jgi:hypothetical protein
VSGTSCLRAPFAAAASLVLAGAVVVGCATVDPPPEASNGVGLTRADAIELAREAAPHAAAYPEVTVAERGPFGQLEGFDRMLDDEPPADRWVWQITLCEGCGPLSGRSTTVILDYLDGRIYGVIDMIG